jgi:dienelactone hydrolase
MCTFTCSYFSQTQQGADIIASSLKTTVYMPDFFEPNAAFPMEKFPPKTDQDKADIQAIFAGTAAATAKLNAFGEALKVNGAKKVGVYGFCWGER